MGPRINLAPTWNFARKTKNIPVNDTTTPTSIVGPQCLNAHLLAPHDRGESQERFGMGREGLTRDWLLKDREATQTGAGEYEGTAT